MNRFGFIMHPLDVSDYRRKFKFAAKLPDRWLEAATKHLPPFTVSQITGIQSVLGPEIDGWFVGCPLTARQMVELPVDYVTKKIIRSAQKAQEKGAHIVGLGAFTAVVGDAGLSVARAVDIPVTTGNSYTVATALQGVQMAADMFDLDLPRANIAVLGASGSIGRASARMLARSGYDVTLVARRREPLMETAAIIEDDTGRVPSVKTDVNEAVRLADVIIAVTSALEGIIDASLLKPGAIVCDVARPRNVAREVGENRADVFVFEGGVVTPPGEPEFNFNFGFPPRTCYACMAETMILALEGRMESFSLGRDLQVEQIEEITHLAQKHGFELSGLRSFERAVTPEHVEQVKHHAQAKKKVISV